MVTLRTWPSRAGRQIRSGLHVRTQRHDRTGRARLPRFRLALIWRRARRDTTAPEGNRSPRFVHVEQRLQLVLAWNLEIRRVFERIVGTVLRAKPAARLLTRLAPAMTLGRAAVRRQALVDQAMPRRAVMSLLRRQRETEQDLPRFARKTADATAAPASAPTRLAAAGAPMHQSAMLAWPLQRPTRRARRGNVDHFSTLSPTPTLRVARRWSASAPRLVWAQNSDDPTPSRPVRHVFRRWQEPAHTAVARRRVDLVWRKPSPTGTVQGETMSQPVRRAATPSSPPNFDPASPAAATSVVAATSGGRSPGASGLQIDPATMNRLTHEVIGRIERKLRVERERRGG